MNRIIRLSLVLALITSHAVAATAPTDTLDVAVMKGLTSKGSRIGWDKLRLGMTLQQAEASANKKLRLAQESYGGAPTGTFGAETTIGKRPVSLSFSGKSASSELLLILIKGSTNCDHAQFSTLTKTIERRIGVKQIEAETCSTKFALPGPDNKLQWVLLKSDGLWIGYANQFD